MSTEQFDDLGMAEFFRDVSEPFRRRPLSRRRKASAVIGAAASVAVIAALVTVPPTALAADTVQETVAYWNELPVDLPAEDPVPTYTVLLDRNGDQFAQFYSENRIPVELEQISPHFVDALVATEDSRFYDHNGVDPKGLLRAVAVNAGGGNRQGGSTITQQLVENIRLIHASDDAEAAAAKAGSLGGKIQEAKYATAMEERYSKDEILEMYANTVYFGAGSYGVATAAKRYFNVSAADLTLGQAATLVGLVKNPNGYNPLENPERAQDRRDTVLYRMLGEEKITQEQFDTATAEPLTTTPGDFDNGCYDSTYPLYCTFVMKEILTDPAFGETAADRELRLYTGGMTIRTALDPAAMKAAENAARSALGDDNRVAAGVAVVEPGTGHVTAIGQNRQFGQGEGQTEVIYADSGFQTGSTFKAIALATAFEQGISPQLTMASPATYRPRGMASPPGGHSNSGHVGYGPMNAVQATGKSANTWFIQLVERTGVREVADMANRLGIASIPDDLTGAEASIVLGAYESTPLEMATAYATFAAGGIRCEPTPIVEVTRTGTGEELPAPDTDCERVLMPGVAATMNEVLQAPLAAGGTAEKSTIGRPAAGKTGTSNSFASAWFVGYTPQYATAVWVGDPRGGSAHPLRNFWAGGQLLPYGDGGNVAAPIWAAVMTPLHTGLPAKGFPGAGAPIMSLRTTDVPDTRGMAVPQAVGTLQAAGLEVRIAPTTAAVPGAAPDTVAAQDVAGTVATLTLVDGSDPALLGGQVVHDPATDDAQVMALEENR